ncbi:MAG: type II toxin-antitoxin system Phd/YefM family antitoxin [Thermodesulfobacteriota bacterium]
METNTVSIAEGKKDFSRLIRNSIENKSEIVVTRRGKPVAVILPFDQYRRSRKQDGYQKILESRQTFLKSGLSAKKVFRESRKRLEEKH